MTAPSLAYQDAMNGIAILYDALSNAENELDKLKNAWIKCSNKAPKVGQKIIFLNDESGDVDVGIVKRIEIEPNHHDVFALTFKYAVVTNKGGEYIGIATHWQPLPEPPKDE